jgi:hypothetical protein
MDTESKVMAEIERLKTVEVAYGLLQAENAKLLRGINFIACMDSRTHHVQDGIKFARDTLAALEVTP